MTTTTEVYEGRKEMSGMNPASDSLRKFYPFGVRIVTGNDYGLPVGKEFPWARCKEGGGSPFPFEVFSYAGDYRVYQLKSSEVVVLMETSE